MRISRKPIIFCCGFALICAIIGGTQRYSATLQFNENLVSNSAQFTETLYDFLTIPENQTLSTEQLVSKYLSAYDNPTILSGAKPPIRLLTEFELATGDWVDIDKLPEITKAELKEIEDNKKKSKQTKLIALHQSVLNFRRNPLIYALQYSAIAFSISVITIFFLVTTAPLIWYFMLTRFSELSLAIQGKHPR